MPKGDSTCENKGGITILFCPRANSALQSCKKNTAVTHLRVKRCGKEHFQLGREAPNYSPQERVGTRFHRKPLIPQSSEICRGRALFPCPLHPRV